MGYYVQGYGNITIQKSNEEKAYQAMCALNDLDHLKRGGSWSALTDADGSRPSGMGFHPNRWFSWMDPNYPETCQDFLSVLNDLGFGVEVDSVSNGHTDYRVSYDNKSGQEDLFLEAIAPYVEGGSIEWFGEDGERWLNKFENGTMATLVGKIVYE